ncbi:xanthine dehydrogenase family protein subunit M [Alsobacter sp. KACC 23698]|uniref:Xanthine dehydrogenase family protein subunit M n=1 Tax=Alsobacter sp. KACC 23698 TaxID=3149229 RepID=A0AAU7JGX1_9HYPH
MRPFQYSRPETVREAVSLADVGRGAAVSSPAAFLAGGTTLVDLMKLDVMRPQALVDVKGLAEQEPDMRGVQASERGLRIGALAPMAMVADDETVKRDYPALSQSLLLAASAQLRNMATLGGNLLQRTRCPYFRDTSWDACNKREPGSGCSALGGVNRLHAVLGVSQHCIASYPGDFAQALVALDGAVETVGPRGRRRIEAARLHRLPGDAPEIETVLDPGELITAITVPAKPWARRSLYLKVRDRESYAFALASAAVALDLDGDTVRDARVALGGVAAIPWRAYEAEEVLRGQRFDEDLARKAASAAFERARPSGDNAFKVKLGQETLVRALIQAAEMEG